MTQTLGRDTKVTLEEIEPAMADDKKLGWDELPLGAVVPTGGNAVEYETGSWRSRRPIFHADRCINCFFCWVFCPDFSILAQDGQVVGIDYYHCKGCGICSTECPVKGEKAITMEDESKFEGQEA